MKFRIFIKTDSREWFEDYDENTDNPEEWAKNIIAFFNSTLKPGEKKRTLLSVEVIGKENTKHDWVKYTGGMSVNFRGSNVDVMFCNKCGITGKRFGMSKTVKIDSKYSKKVFRTCTPETLKAKSLM